jgi:hypothetical protein
MMTATETLERIELHKPLDVPANVRALLVNAQTAADKLDPDLRPDVRKARRDALLSEAWDRALITMEEYVAATEAEAATAIAKAREAAHWRKAGDVDPNDLRVTARVPGLIASIAQLADPADVVDLVDDVLAEDHGFTMRAAVPPALERLRRMAREREAYPSQASRQRQQAAAAALSMLETKYKAWRKAHPTLSEQIARIESERDVKITRRRADFAMFRQAYGMR